MKHTLNLMRTLITTLFVVGVLSVSLAQGGGGGGGGRGGFGGGQRGGFGGRNGTDLLGLATRADVQTDLVVTPEQKTKIDALQQAVQDARRQQMQELRNSGGGGNFDPAAMRAQMEKQAAENEKKLAEILKPEQMVRLKEIRIQLQGNRAILMEDVQKALKVTDDQKAKIKKLQDDLNTANQNLRDEMRNGGGDRQAIMERMNKNNETFNTELGKVLTTAQADQLKKMGGKPFKAATTGGGGGGGR